MRWRASLAEPSVRTPSTKRTVMVSPLLAARSSKESTRCRSSKAAPQAAAFDGRHRVDSFELLAANNGETMPVRFVDGVLTEGSAKEARHLMRALSNDQE